MCYGLNSPSFVLRASGAFVFLPTSEKQSVPSSLCCLTCSSSSIHPFPSIGFYLFFLKTRGAISLNAEVMAWVEEGNICTSGELRKGKSHPSCLNVLCQLGVTFITGLSGCFFFFFLRGRDQHHLALVLCGIHCLDHAGCQGCCSDINI